MAEGVLAQLHELRAQIQAVADAVAEMRRTGGYGLGELPPEADTGEAISNVVLAYRHLEDARMRLGKAVQALQGGVSIYDREATVAEAGRK
jgi:hypothetical protein